MSLFLKAFGGARVAVGALSWLAPTLSTRIFGLGSDDRQAVITQLFGVRDLTLGALTATSSGPALAQVLRLGIAIDAADTVAALRQIRAGNMSTHAVFGVGVGAALFATLGVVALSQEESS